MSSGVITVFNYTSVNYNTDQTPRAYAVGSDCARLSGLLDNCVDEQERDVERKKDPCPTKHLIECQQSDPELIQSLQDALCESEAAKVPTCFYMRSGVRMRKWRPPTVSPDEEWQVSHQM